MKLRVLGAGVLAVAILSTIDIFGGWRSAAVPTPFISARSVVRVEISAVPLPTRAAMPPTLRSTVTNRAMIKRLVSDINALPANTVAGSACSTDAFNNAHADLVFDERHGLSVFVYVIPDCGNPGGVCIGAPGSCRSVNLPASSTLWADIFKDVRH